MQPKMGRLQTITALVGGGYAPVAATVATQLASTATVASAATAETFTTTMAMSVLPCDSPSNIS